ncbi:MULTISPECIES: chromosome partitioning protein [Frankia]|nr:MULTISPECIES: chromosome partitioning protein [Frankia]
MTGIEIAVGVLAAWALRKARRVGDRVDGGIDTETDRLVDAGMDRVHDLVSGVLGENDPVLARVEEETQDTGEVSVRTRQRLALALEDATDHDPAFAAALAQAVEQVRAATTSGGGHSLVGNLFTGPTAIQQGDHNRQTNTFTG